MTLFSSDQKFIVTGATSGIGEGVALLLNELGASVIAIGRNDDKLASLKQKAKFSEAMFVEKKDLSENIVELPDYVKSLKDKYGKFQGLAYCAGYGQVKPARAIDFKELKDTFDINFFAPYMMAKSFIDKRNHNGQGTSCVFVSSISEEHCDKGQSSYAASKAALVASIRCIAKECAVQGVRFNCVSPSAIDTPLLKLSDIEVLEAQEKLYPMGFGKVEDVAEMIVFLLSSKTKWITAQNYIIDCGAIL